MKSFLKTVLYVFHFSCLAASVLAQQVPDTSFTFKIQAPAYGTGKGPVILFDEFHNNPATLKGQYLPFGKLLRQDGYIIRPTREKLSQASLAGAGIYVSVNALYDPMNWDLPARSAFAGDEVDVLYQWVNNGGSLFLVSDHMPVGASVNAIAMKFGFNIANGFALKKTRTPERFSRSGGGLHESVITNTPGATIDSIRTWGGTGFIAPKNAIILLPGRFV